MKYRSRLVEIEALRWDYDAPVTVNALLEERAREIVAWVNANGGEARYERQGSPSGADRIAVRTINGWAYALPGWYVVMGETEFGGTGASWERERIRDFYPCDPETFQRRWEAIVDDPEDHNELHPGEVF
jgi:hypothetical protein